MPVLTPEEYRARASQIYDPSYAVKIANENTAFNNTMAQYQDQASQVNANAVKSTDTNNRNTALNQNQYNNNTLSRGMARSSVASTGLAGIANTGARVNGEIEQDKNQQLNNLETLKSNLRASLESTLKGLASEREGGINSMALQLQQRDEDLQRQLDTAAEDKRRYEQEWAFKQQQYADAQKAAAIATSAKKSSGGSSSGSSGGNKSLYSNALAALQQVMQQRGNGNQFIRDFEPQWAAQGMTSTQINTLKKYVSDYFYTPEENIQYHKTTYNQRPVTEGL